MSRSATCTVRPGCLNQHCLPPLVICHNFFVRSAVLFLINLIFIINILSVSQCRHIRAYFMFGLNWIRFFSDVLRCDPCVCVCVHICNGWAKYRYAANQTNQNNRFSSGSDQSEIHLCATCEFYNYLYIFRFSLEKK